MTQANDAIHTIAHGPRSLPFPVVRQRNGIDQRVSIAMSGYGSAADVARATEVGFDGHLTKPASGDDCKALVTKLRERGTLA